MEQEAIRELSIKKHHLLLELRNYDASNASLASTGGGATSVSGTNAAVAAASGAVNATKKFLTRGSSAVSKAIDVDTPQRPPGAIPVRKDRNKSLLSEMMY